MSIQGTIKRYSLILEKTSRNHYPSFERIKDYLFDHGFEISSRTIQRDIEQIRNEFGISILYDRDRNGYYLDEENSINIDSFLRFLEIMNTADLLAETLRDSRDNLDYIQFESAIRLRGIENLKPLLKAIKLRREITFIHESYQSEKRSKYAVKPYLLKEYQRRWYLVAFVPNYNDMRVFGIDRIYELEVTKKVFSDNLDTDPATLFRNTIGVTYSVNQLEEVILSVDPLQGKYIQSLPLHPSQEIVAGSEDQLVVKLRVIPNLEFCQKILMFGDRVTILQPKWLADEVKTILKKALNKYEIL